MNGTVKSVSRMCQTHGGAGGYMRACRQSDLCYFRFGAVLWVTSGKTDVVEINQVELRNNQI